MVARDHLLYLISFQKNSKKLKRPQNQSNESHLHCHILNDFEQSEKLEKSGKFFPSKLSLVLYESSSFPLKWLY